MVDELAEKIAEAKEKMFGAQPPSSGKAILLFKGDADVQSLDPNVVVRKIE